MNISFNDYLSSTTLAPSSVKKYESAVRTISDLMLKLGVISKSLSNMTSLEYNAAYVSILADATFIAKDNNGNQMYKRALDYYKDYLQSI